MTLGFFFTLGMSLEKWEELGILQREIKIFIEHLKRKNFFRVYFFTYGTNDFRYKFQGIEILPKPLCFASRLGNFFYSFLIPFIYQKQIKKCDVLRTNQMPGAWSAIIAKKIFSKPVILRTGYTLSRRGKYAGKMGRFASLIERFCYKNADISFVSSDYQKSLLGNRYNIKEIYILPNYVDTEIFKPLFLPKDRDIVYIGRLSPEKNLASLFLALQGSDYALDIYGDGPEKNNLKVLAQNIGIAVSFSGQVENEKLPVLLSRYKLFILPSLIENGAKSLLEAMACGLCCIGTDIPGINDAIKHLETGYICGCGQESIRQAITTLMQDTPLRERLGESASQFIRKNYSLESVVEKENSLIRKLIA